MCSQGRTDRCSEPKADSGVRARMFYLPRMPTFDFETLRVSLGRIPEYSKSFAVWLHNTLDTERTRRAASEVRTFLEAECACLSEASEWPMSEIEAVLDRLTTMDVSTLSRGGHVFVAWIITELSIQIEERARCNQDA